MPVRAGVFPIHDLALHCVLGLLVLHEAVLETCVMLAVEVDEF